MTPIRRSAGIRDVTFGANVTMSNNATATNPAAALRAYSYGNGDGSTTFNIPGSSWENSERG